MLFENLLLKPKIVINYNYAIYCFIVCHTFNKAVSLEVKACKGKWWMPWVIEAMKDVLDCDKLWGAVKKL